VDDARVEEAACGEFERAHASASKGCGATWPPTVQHRKIEHTQ
jgi:hypothetical protein